MRYDDNRYDDNRYDDHDDDLWDDELELSVDDRQPVRDDEPRYPHAPESHYTPYQPPYDDHDTPDEDAGTSDNDYYSDDEPEPEAPSRQKQRSLGLFRKRKRKKEEEDEEYKDEDEDDEEDDADNDYFDSTHEARPRSRKPKTPKLDPEDPDYWISDEEDSPFSGIIPSSGGKWKWQLAAAVGLITLLIGAWAWFFRPYADGAVKYGYIRNMERRGSLFKTFEGTMIPYKELGDPDPLYFQQLPFSVASDSLATRMKRMMLGCVPVRVEYETYNTSLPWKGESRMVIVKVDTADTRSILPPEFRINDK